MTDAAEKIKIDIWSDVVCPWCYVGEGRLGEAIRAERLEDRIEIETHSFELDPNAKDGSGEDNIRAPPVEARAGPRADSRDGAEDQRPGGRDRA